MTWKKVKLKMLLSQSVQNGYSPVCPKTPNGKWVLGLGALSDYGLDATQVKPAPTNDSRVDNFLLHPGDFLVSRSNTRDKVGRSALFKGQIKYCSYPDLMMRFRVKRTAVFPEFLEKYLISHEAVRYFQRSASGTSGSMVKINKSVVENLLVPLPPFSEQFAIADLLSTWDTAIEKTKKLIAAKERQFSAMLRRMISKIQTRTHIRGFAIEVSTRNRDQNINRVLSVTNHSGLVLPENRFQRRIASSDLGNYKVVVLGQYAYNPSRINVGSIARLEGWETGVLSPMYVVFQVDENKVSSDFFHHWLASPEAKQRIRKSAQGSVRETVSFSDFGAIPFPLPSLKRQLMIANALNNARQEINLLSDIADAIQQQKHGLMQKLLTGKWRAKHDEDT